MRVNINPGFLVLQLCAVLVIGLKCAMYAFASALIHELGHFAAIALLGGRVSAFNLGAAGAEIRYVGNMSYKSDFIVAVAGPCANIAAAFLAARLLNSDWAEYKNLFAGANMIYAVINLVPISITDGGRALSAAVGSTLGANAAERLVAALDAVFSVGALICGVLLLRFWGNPSLLVCGILITRSVNLKSIMTKWFVEKNKKLFK